MAKGIFVILFKKVSNQELVDFTKSFSIMIKSGIPINESLGFLEDQTDSKAFKKIVNNIKQSIESGNSLTDAFLKEEKIFGSIFISLIRSGEASGTLEKNFIFLSDWLERENNLRREISSATLYPKIIFSSTLILGGGLMVFILPRLVPVLTSVRVDLPITTRILLFAASFIENYWLLTIIIATLFVIISKLLLKIYAVRKVIQGMYLHLPLFGKLSKSYQLALMSQLFSTLFQAGITIREALEIIGDAMTNIYYKESIKKLRRRVGMGTAISKGMRGYPNLYPKTFINIIATGEKSGTIDESFGYLSEFYSDEVRTKTKRLPTIIEPLLLIVIGLVVGFIALSIITPIYGLLEGIGQ